ncbi:zinc finger protein 638-like, partial [Passer montanus]|uniref:zinc finger protein 638-like n=1 Tax=Passer montanus TaxID=9160 RepID=UPI001961336A
AGAEACCVLLVSNLPAKGCSGRDIAGLARPFGGLRDLLVVSSHKKDWDGWVGRGQDWDGWVARGQDWAGGQRCSPVPQAGAEACCVLLVSNLPAKGCSGRDIAGLARPFGGLRDLLVVSSHKKAFLEIPCAAAESMVKFYGCFPMCLDGNQLQIRHEPRHRSLRDE